MLPCNKQRKRDMATTNAERQKKFREKHKYQTRRLDMRISDEAWSALERLVKDSGMTKRKFLEKLFVELDSEKMMKMSRDELELYLALDD